MIKKSLQRRIRQHILAKNHDFFAIVQPGFEHRALVELRNLDIGTIFAQTDGGVEFSGRLHDCYRVNICSRIINRLLLRILAVKATGFKELNKKVNKFPWELYLNPFSARKYYITAHRSRLYHTGRIENEIEDAIQSRLKAHNNSQSLEWEVPISTQLIFVRYDRDICQLSIDTSGELLYKRGYKRYATAATIRETTASAILLEADMLNYDIVIDPMGGSGTFSIEAAMIYANRQPGFERSFSFQQWPSFQPRSFDYLKKSMKEEFQIANSEFHPKIFFSDIDDKSLCAAKKNIDNLDINHSISITKADFLAEKLPFPCDKKALLVLNPPYGKRLHERELFLLYKKIGDTIRSQYSECGYAIIVPCAECEKALGLPYDQKICFQNGGIKVAVILKRHAWQD